MTALLSIIFLFFLAYAGFSIYQKYKIKAFSLRLLVDNGSFHLLIGLLVGPNLLQLLSEDILEQLKFLVALVLGWAGFLIGLQLKLGELKRFQPGYFLFAFTNFILFAILFLCSMMFIIYIFKLDFSPVIYAPLILLATASSPIIIGVLKSAGDVKGQLMHLLQFSVAWENILCVASHGFLMIIINPYFGFDLSSTYVIIGSLGFSFLMAYLFYRVAENIKNEQQYFLLLVGFLLVLTGVTLNLNISLIFSSFVFGVILTNLPIETRKLYHSIADVEKPLYFLMVIFVGASIVEFYLPMLTITLVFILSRTIIKYAAGYGARFAIENPRSLPHKIGIEHLGMGGIALAMVLDYHLNFNNLSSQYLLIIVAISVPANALFYSAITRRNV